MICQKATAGSHRTALLAGLPARLSTPHLTATGRHRLLSQGPGAHVRPSGLHTMTSGTLPTSRACAGLTVQHRRMATPSNPRPVTSWNIFVTPGRAPCPLCPHHHGCVRSGPDVHARRAGARPARGCPAQQDACGPRPRRPSRRWLGLRCMEASRPRRPSAC